MASLTANSPSPRTVPPTSSTPSATNDTTTTTTADDDDDDNLPLPFPTVLPRSDFLTPAFHPASYLSSLPSRHQTLEDLRADLRERSAAISAELLELVNSNYTAFLSLGTDLRGGDDRVEDVRVALLGSRRAMEDVRARVAERREEAGRLGGELGQVRDGIEMGRLMIEVSDRLDDLEERLAVDSLPGGREDEEDEEEEEEEDDDDDEGLVGSSPARLTRCAQQCNRIAALIQGLDRGRPFIMKQEERLTRCRNTLLLDLSNALKESRSAGVKGQDRAIRYLGIYRVIGAHDEAVKALRKK